MAERLTRKQAKELSIETWEWLYKYPSKDKDDMPKRIWKQIWYWRKELWATHDCGLCFLYYGKCGKCILAQKDMECSIDQSLWSMWGHARVTKERKEYAGLILEIIRNWKV